MAYTGTISVSKAVFKNNSADFGGVFFVADGTVIISDSLLTNNRATKQDAWSDCGCYLNLSIFDNFESKISFMCILICH